jgi:hypothetical protein
MLSAVQPGPSRSEGLAQSGEQESRQVLDFHRDFHGVVFKEI